MSFHCLSHGMNETNPHWPPGRAVPLHVYELQLLLVTTIDLLLHIERGIEAFLWRSLYLQLFCSVKHLRPPFSLDFSSSEPFFLGRQRLPTKPGWVREATWLEGRKVKAKGCTGTADSVCVCVSQWKCVALKYLRKLLLLLRLLSLFWLTHCWTSGAVNKYISDIFHLT